MAEFFSMVISALGGAVVGATVLWWVLGRGNKEQSGEWGNYLANPKIEFLDDGRKAKLLEEFAYIDRNLKVWIVPKDHTVDGASIPRIFWVGTGGPFTGKFRNASIVHDYECDVRERPWKDVHRMFYEACRCSGVPELRAKILFAAVYLFGPKWDLTVEIQQIQKTSPAGDPVTLSSPVALDDLTRRTADLDNATMTKLEEYITKNNPSFVEIMQLDPQEFRQDDDPPGPSKKPPVNYPKS